MTQSATPPTESLTVTVSLVLTVEVDGKEAKRLEASYQTDNSPFRVAEHAIAAVCNDITHRENGWAARHGAEYAVPGSGWVTLTLEMSTAEDIPAWGHRWAVQATSNTNLLRHLCAAVQTLQDYADGWNVKHKRQAAELTGYEPDLAGTALGMMIRAQNSAPQQGRAKGEGPPRFTYPTS